MCDLDKLWEPIRSAVDRKLIPGAAAGIWHKGSTIHYADGIAVDGANKPPAHYDTIYDCASLTKVTVTLPLILTLIQHGEMALDDVAATYLPELQGERHRAITIRQLLSHTSGLAASHDFYSENWTMERILRYAGNAALTSQPGEKVVYSDLGYLLLGVIIERLLDMRLDQAAKRYILDPLDMRDSCYCPVPELRQRIAATEWLPDGSEYWHGIVHDENARALGGISGHAGLFSTTADLLKYAREWLMPAAASGSGLLSPAVIAASLSVQTPPFTQDSKRGLGWVLKGDTADVSGALFSEAAFGHTGFTGTSLYIDPQRQLAVVLLTNRVHYGRQHNITKLRLSFHEAVASIFH